MAGSRIAEKRLLVAIPALNEQGSVGDVVSQIRARFPEVDVLVIDDGSTDHTSARALQAGAMVCRLPFNLGVGGAMRTAFKFALRSGYEVVIQVDADGQHDLESLRALVDQVGPADLVIGARFAGVGDYRVPPPRRAAMWFLSKVLSRLAHRQLTDVTSGYRASGARAIALFAVHYPAEYLGDTVESLVIAVRTGLEVQQVPVKMRRREVGSSSQSSVKAFAYLVRAALALMLALVRQWPVPEEVTITLDAVGDTPS